MEKGHPRKNKTAHTLDQKREDVQYSLTLNRSCDFQNNE